MSAQEAVQSIVVWLCIVLDLFISLAQHHLTCDSRKAVYSKASVFTIIQLHLVEYYISLGNMELYVVRNCAEGFVP